MRRKKIIIFGNFHILAKTKKQFNGAKHDNFSLMMFPLPNLTVVGVCSIKIKKEKLVLSMLEGDMEFPLEFIRKLANKSGKDLWLNKTYLP